MFSIGFKAVPNNLPSVIDITDISTGNETVLSKFVKITKTDLTEQTFPFVHASDATVQITGLDKDYALIIILSVTTTIDTYTKSYETVSLGYANQIKRNRQIALEIDKTIQDTDLFKKQSLELNYFRMVAKDRARFSDLVGAQKAVDAIADMDLGKYLSCPTL